MLRFGGHVWLAILLLLPWVSWAQSSGTNAVAAPSLPHDPLKFLELAAKVNGLGSDEAGPWHVKARFQFFDDQGKVRESGTYEAFWKSPNRYRVSYSSPSYTRTIWANESGTFATSNLEWPGDVEWMIRRSLFDVAPEPSTFERSNLSWREVSTGNRANCIDAIPNYVKVRPLEIPVYCFDFGTPILRFGSEIYQRYQEIFNNIVLMGGTHVAKDVQLNRGGNPYFRLHIDLLAPLPAAGDELFRPDPAAVQIPSGIVIDTDMRDIQATYMVGIPNSLSGILTSQTAASITARFAAGLAAPQYNEREAIVQVLVNKQGKVVDARPVQGDMRAQFKAVASARLWEFEPYLVQGEPTEFYTELEF